MTERNGLRTTTYLSPPEVSARYGGKISIRTLANWRWAGIGPRFTRLGVKIFYPEHELMAWEDKNTVTHTGAYRK